MSFHFIERISNNTILLPSICILVGLGYHRFCNFVLAHEVLKPRVAAACEKLCGNDAMLSSQLNRKAVS